MNMVATIRPQLGIWDQWSDDDVRFKRIIKRSLLAFAIIGVLIPWLPVMKPEPLEPVKVPDRIAKMLLDNRPAHVPRKKVVEQVPDEPVKPEVKKTRPEKVTKKQTVKPARKRESVKDKVSKVGLLALSQELADIQAMAPTPAQQVKTMRRAAQAKTAAPRSAQAHSVAKTSAGLGEKLNIGSNKTKLSDRSLSRVDMPEAVSREIAREGLPNTRARTESEVSLVLARSKSSFDILYNRELRKRPGIKGRVLFEIKIAPSGRVLSCRIIESELASAKLERRLILKIKSLDFGAKDVDTTIINYPLEFSPA